MITKGLNLKRYMDTDKTVENDELEVNDSYEEDNTETEETASEDEQSDEQEDSDGTDEVTFTRDELAERDKDIRREQDKRNKERFSKSKESTKVSNKENPQKEEVASDEISRLRLEMKGVESKSQQDFIMKFANVEGITPTEALKDDVVQAKLEKMKAEGAKNRATQSPINRTGKPATKGVDYWVKQVEAGKANSTDPAMRKKVRTSMASNLQS